MLWLWTWLIFIKASYLCIHPYHLYSHHRRFFRILAICRKRIQRITANAKENWALFLSSNGVYRSVCAYHGDTCVAERERIPYDGMWGRRCLRLKVFELNDVIARSKFIVCRERWLISMMSNQAYSCLHIK